MTDRADRSGSPSATRDRADILKEIEQATRQAHVEFKAERAAVRQREAETDPPLFARRARRRKVVLFSLLSLALAALTGLNLAGYGPLRLTQQPPSPAETDHMLRSTLYMAVMDIEAYRQATGALPRQFADLGIKGSGSWIYEPLGGGNYTLTFSDGRSRVTYISTRSPEVFFTGLTLLGQPRETAGAKP
jgi:hypothetical protein